MASLLRIASVGIALEGPERPERGWGELAGFLSSSSGPVDVRLSWRMLAGLPNPGLEGEAAFEDLPHGAVRFRRADFDGTFDPARGTGALATSPTPAALRAALRFVVSLALLERGGLLLHAAALRRDGAAYVLFGPSGAGKSTAAALSAGRAEVLTDELCGLVPGPWRAFGTPFAGQLAGRTMPGEAPVRVLAMLEQAPEVSTGPAGEPEAVRRLYAQVFRPSHDPGRHARWLGACRSAATEVPCTRLRFRKDPSFWEVLAA